MTVSNNIGRTQSTASASQTIFPYNFQIDDEANLNVYQRASGSTPDDSADLLTITVDYTVTGVGDANGGTIVLVTGASAGDIITVTSNTPAERDTTFATGGAISSANLNQEFDNLILIYQNLLASVPQRSLLYPASATIADKDRILPILGPDETWAMNSAGTAIETVELPSGGSAAKNSTYVTMTDETATEPNSYPLSEIGNGLMVNLVSSTAIEVRTLTGTADEIDITNGSGVGGNPTFRIAENPIIPGTAGMGIPQGTTAERVTPASGIGLRYNTTLQQVEFYDGSAWTQLEDSGDFSGLANLKFILQQSDALAPNAQGLGDLSTGILKNTTSTGVLSISAPLTSIDGLTTAADKMIYTTASNVYSVTDLTAYARTLLAETTDSGARTILGLGTMATQNANNVAITGGMISANIVSSTINATTIGASIASTGAFTTITSSGNVDFGSGTSTFKINSSTPNINTILDEDNMASDSNTALATQQSIKAYVDSATAGGITPAALTKVDDTNVTLTLGGTPNTALLQATSLTLGWTGTLSETRGGTAQSTYTLGDILYSSATNTLSKLSGNTTTSKMFLSQTGDGVNSAAPTWEVINGSDITGENLTRVNDTNVTLTLGGTPTGSVLNSVSLTLGWTGQLSVTRGGTGTGTTFTQGSVVFAGAGGIYSQDNANLFWDDSNNRLGIGTATPASDFEIYKATGELIQKITAASNSASYINITNANPSARFDIGVGPLVDDKYFIWGYGTVKPIAFGTNATERMIIDPLGNVVVNTAAIATTATDGFLYIPSTAGTPTGTPTSYTGRIPMVFDSTNNLLYMYDGSWLGRTFGGKIPVSEGGTGTSTAFTQGNIVYAGTSGVYSQDADLFWDAKNTCLAIGNSGSGSSTATVLIATPGINNHLGVLIAGFGASIGWGLTMKPATSSDAEYIRWDDSTGTQIASIATTSSQTVVAYNTTSDRRLKENLVSTSVLDKIDAVPVYELNFKKDPDKVRMVSMLADELQSEFPYLVRGDKDAVNEDGIISPQQVDYSKLTPILWRAIQELRAQVNSLVNA